MRPRSRITSIAAVVLAAACSKPQDTTLTKGSGPEVAAAPDEAAARQAITNANERFLNGMKQGDLSVVKQNYQDDAIVMMPNEEPWVGAAGLDKGFANFFAQARIKEGKVTTENVMLGGDLAIETGSYEWTLQPKTGNAVQDKGKYLTVWKHQADGSWKIVRDISNSNQPAQ